MERVEELSKLQQHKMKNKSADCKWASSKVPELSKSSLSAPVKIDGFYLGRHREDLVGKRVLCLPRTFEVAAPSPVQLSSSLWSPSILKALKENERKDGSEPFWCPKHHHHQPNQQTFISLSESIKYRPDSQNNDSTNTDSAFSVGNTSISGTSNKRIRNRQQHRKNSPLSSVSQRSFSVMKSARQAKTDLLVNTEPMQQKNIDDSGCDQTAAIPKCSLCFETNTSVDDSEKHLGRLASLPWRLGTIRAVSHRDLSDEAISIMIEFDLLDWQNREWYPLRDSSIDQEASDRDSLDNQLDSINKQLTNTSPKRKAKGRGHCDATGIARSGKSQEDDIPSNSARDQCKKRTRNDAGITEDDWEITRDSASILQGDSQPSKARGAFKVVLVESSICCLKRKNTPTGKDKLWPGLVSAMKIILVDVLCRNRSSNCRYKPLPSLFGFF